MSPLKVSCVSLWALWNGLFLSAWRESFKDLGASTHAVLDQEEADEVERSSATQMLKVLLKRLFRHGFISSFHFQFLASVI